VMASARVRVGGGGSDSDDGGGEDDSDDDDEGEDSRGGPGAMGEGSRTWTAIGYNTTRLRGTADSTRRATAIDDQLDGRQRTTGDTVVPPSGAQEKGGGL